MARKRLGPARGFGNEGFGAGAPVTEATGDMFAPDVAPSPASAPSSRPGLAQPSALAPVAQTVAQPVTPPIAQVTAVAAAQAAAERLAEDMRQARSEGRMVLALPLAEIAADWLVRDRLAADADELEALKTSLRDRGQQTPVEVVDLGEGAVPRYGLVSGWRRLTALRALAEEAAKNGSDPAEQSRFATIQALLRRPETTADAYRAMVEENEIRVGLSYYERARIVVEAAGKGVYPDQAAALSGLFASASRAKRSKIGSFVRLHDALGDRLSFATAISERLGLALVRALESRDFATLLRERLRKGAPQSAEAEIALLDRALSSEAEKGSVTAEKTLKKSGSRPDQTPISDQDSGPVSLPVSARGGTLQLCRENGQLVISGPGLTPEFEAALAAWLQKI